MAQHRTRCLYPPTNGEFNPDRTVPMTIDLTKLAANAELVERLAWDFDLRIDIAPPEPAWFTIEGVSDLELIGSEGAGGSFARLPDARILYVSSEGRAGTIASDLDAFLQLIIAHPYWKDLLKFSCGGKVAEMRRAADALEAMTLEEEEDLAEAREYVRSELILPMPEDAVGALHQVVSTSRLVVRSPDGSARAGLFNRFTIADNPMLRDFAE
jgi:hypothetical protein